MMDSQDNTLNKGIEEEKQQEEVVSNTPSSVTTPEKETEQQALEAPKDEEKAGDTAGTATEEPEAEPKEDLSKKVYNSKKEIYCYDDTELEKAKAQIGAGYKVNRYKGLGEMNYTQLSETTMSREHRKLLRVVLKDDEDTSDKVSLFLGNNADRRKEWINNNIDFTTVDNFIKEVERNEK